MNKFLSVLVSGLIAGSLSVSAFAADAAKPVLAATSAAPTAKVEASKVISTKVTAKKDSGIKAAVKKLAPSAKKTDLKLK
jgi:hypothetical protein